MAHSQVKPPKQEKEAASTEVTEVAPGILRMQLPIDMPGLGHVNCYALEDERGVALVDPGMFGPASWQALMDRLAAAEIPLRRVHSVVVTHSHPDHFGAADKLARETGAEVITHERFRTLWNQDDGELVDAREELTDEERVAQFLHRLEHRPASPWGGTAPGPPPEKLAEMKAHAAMAVEWMRPPRPTMRIVDTQPLRLGGRNWVGLDTPGHTDDHLCLFDEESGVLLSGDQVLPTITPHVSGTVDDALGRYLGSLERLGGLAGVTLALPAHGHPIHDLAGRVTEIAEHHDERVDELLRHSADLGWASVQQLSQRLFAERSWGAMAEDETYAHLEHLRRHGRAERREEAGVLFYKT